MSIVHESKHNPLKPRRGGMVRSGAGHAAPTELERVFESAVAIDMSLLRSWARPHPRWNPGPEWPNPASMAMRRGGHGCDPLPIG
jgi:hypothetical protein